jgi:flagellin
MGFRIQNNIAAFSSLRNLNNSSTALDKSLNRLSSGYRINSAADDAAGMASSMRFRAEITSLKQASRNASEANSLLQVAEGAMSQIDLILKRMKELATQASSGNAGSDLSKIQAEADELTSEIDRIVGFTEYNGSTLLDGTFGSVSITSGSIGNLLGADGVENIDVTNAAGSTVFNVTTDTSGGGDGLLVMEANVNGTTVTQSLSLTPAAGLNPNEDYTFNFTALGTKITVNDGFWAVYSAHGTAGSFTTTGLGDATFQIGDKGAGAGGADSRLSFSLSNLATAAINNGSALSVDLSTQSGAQTALNDIDDSISYLAEKRGSLGALVNRFTYAQSNLAVTIENKTASESIIRDVDMAEEMSNFTKNQILVQAGTSMLAQANLVPQNVLSLLA